MTNKPAFYKAQKADEKTVSRVNAKMVEDYNKSKQTSQ